MNVKKNDDRMELLGRLEDLQNRCIALSNAAAKIAGELLEAQRDFYKLTAQGGLNNERI